MARGCAKEHTKIRFPQHKGVGAMKQYKLKAWPDLPANFKRTAHRRLLSVLSQRYLGEAEMQRVSGASSAELRELLQFLAQEDLLDSRDAEVAANAAGWRLPNMLTGWLRRA
jgi:hypothetical protein